jgi:hypothetical protein
MSWTPCISNCLPDFSTWSFPVLIKQEQYNPLAAPSKGVFRFSEWRQNKMCHLWPLSSFFLLNMWLLKNYYYHCAGWGYIVAFTKVLTMYQIYHTWIHPFICSLSFPPHQMFKCTNFYILSLALWGFSWHSLPPVPASCLASLRPSIFPILNPSNLFF